MYRIRVEDLPAPPSRVFVGAERGDGGVSAYLVNAPLGKGPVPTTIPYDKVAFVQAGRARWTVNGEEHETAAGDILVVNAAEIHTFCAAGDEPLVLISPFPSSERPPY